MATARADQKIRNQVSPSLHEALGEPVWKPGTQDIFLGRRNIVRNAVEGDGTLIRVIQNESRTGIVVPRLSNGSGIDQVFCILLQLDFEVLFAGGRVVFRQQR